MDGSPPIEPAIEPCPESAAESRADATPMMVQYMALKEANPGHLLFYRMGDFYEMFFDDAVQAAEALDITLTRRGKHGDQDVPMAGVPVKSHEGYLERLIRKGFKVAVCEQVEDPAEARKRAGAKALVRRDVVRLVTPGTLTEDSLLDARRHNFLAAIADAGGSLALASVDVSTGDFLVDRFEDNGLLSALSRIEPSEILIADRIRDDSRLEAVVRERGRTLTVLPDHRFDSQSGAKRLEARFGTGLEEDLSRAERAAAGALVDYVEATQKGRLPRLSPPRRRTGDEAMEIDPATRRNLEIVRTGEGERRGSLLDTIDRTVTGAGARLLGSWLAAPLAEPAAIEHRLDAVEWLVADISLRESLRSHLREAPDIARALSRLTVGRGGPRDLVAIRAALGVAAELQALVRAARGGGLATEPPACLLTAADDIGDQAALARTLTEAIAEEPPLLARDGGAVREGHSSELDELRTLRDESRRLIAGLQNRYAEETRVTSLKIRHNNVLGYFVETSANHGDAVRGDDRFVHRQTLANAVRFTTVELGELQDRIARAADDASALEIAIVEEMTALVAANAEPLALAASALARFDTVSALADLAEARAWTRPRVDRSLCFHIEGGRHPVVEAALARDGERFVANDCDLSPEDADGSSGRLWLLTGPNMAGKSTFLRQNALIAILAQIGSFVPASSAHIGVVDRLFSRVGAADDLARGRSTFMVEMVETASILGRAGPRSLVILDEIGRGTATFDGLSIAWAAVEHLHAVNRCRGLFATHYHELTRLGDRLAGLALRTMRVREWKGDVVFLHEVAPGTADRSYGIHVARLAGLPDAVIARAEAVLDRLEADRSGSAVTTLADDLPLFQIQAAAPVARLKGPSDAEIRLSETDPDALTPRQALDLLYDLKALVGAPSGGVSSGGVSSGKANDHT